ncbi:hypothetical protein MJD09_15605, partial [bacterium]|nr:hypothetical protein [bacterium]
MRSKKITGHLRPWLVFTILTTVALTSWFCTKTQPLAPEDDSQGPLEILVSLLSNPTVVAPGGTSVIQALILDDSNQPVPGKVVAFSTNLGAVSPATRTTNQAGLALCNFLAPAQTGTAEVKATFDSTQTRSLSIEVQSSNPDETTIVPEVTSLLANGLTFTRITSTWKDDDGEPLVGMEVTFGTDLGTIPNAALTNSSGVGQLDLTSANQTGVATITARYGQTLMESVQVVFGQSVPTYLNVSAEPPVILADNQSTSTIKATVSDQANNPVPDGTPVNFEIIDGSGTIESNKMTEAGVASSILTSSNQPDTVTIVARVAQLSDTTTVRYIVGEAATLTISADSTSLPADGTTSTRVTAFVIDAAGHPVVDGTRVTFETDIGDVTPTAQTVNGLAYAQFTSNVTGVANIRASVGSVFDVTTIQLRPGSPNSILLTYDPNSLGVKDSGRNQSITVMAAVVDSKNNPVADGTYVSFSIFSSPGGREFLSNTEPIPTLNGNATVSL